MKDREFVIGLVWAAYWLDRWHGEDRYAGDMLVEALGQKDLGYAQRVARAEEYRFRRGFWARLKRRTNPR